MSSWATINSDADNLQSSSGSAPTKEAEWFALRLKYNSLRDDDSIDILRTIITNAQELLSENADSVELQGMLYTALKLMVQKSLKTGEMSPSEQYKTGLMALKYMPTDDIDEHFVFETISNPM